MPRRTYNKERRRRLSLRERHFRGAKGDVEERPRPFKYSIRDWHGVNHPSISMTGAGWLAASSGGSGSSQAMAAAGRNSSPA